MTNEWIKMVSNPDVMIIDNSQVLLNIQEYSDSKTEPFMKYAPGDRIMHLQVGFSQ